LRECLVVPSVTTGETAIDELITTGFLEEAKAADKEKIAVAVESHFTSSPAISADHTAIHVG
jgi:hypothetical protein